MLVVNTDVEIPTACGLCPFSYRDGYHEDPVPLMCPIQAGKGYGSHKIIVDRFKRDEDCPLRSMDEVEDRMADLLHTEADTADYKYELARKNGVLNAMAVLFGADYEKV